MGSFIELNDTLQITSEQGFPKELDLEAHLSTPISSEAVSEKVFSFTGKAGIRVFKTPPVRNFLVHNVDGKWIYWGHIHMLSVSHDTVANTTNGTFIVTHVFSPEEMKQAHAIIDRNPTTDFFA